MIPLSCRSNLAGRYLGSVWMPGKKKKNAALQRQNAENLKQIAPEKEYRGLSHNFHIHVSVSELFIPMMALPFLLEEICGPTGDGRSVANSWQTFPARPVGKFGRRRKKSGRLLTFVKAIGLKKIFFLLFLKWGKVYYFS